MTDSQEGYVNYFEVLDVPEDAKPGEVRRDYRRRMKDLVAEIARVEITEERRTHYLLEMAKLNAALFVLRDTELRDVYWTTRQGLIALEERWRLAANAATGRAKSEAERAELDDLRREFDGKLRGFLSRYVEELMLEAGRDKECVEASHWDTAHERHAFRILRHYRHTLYQKILERLPYAEVTPPKIDWDERRRTAAALLGGRIH
jgi:hypothetical protein